MRRWASVGLLLTHRPSKRESLMLAQRWFTARPTLVYCWPNVYDVGPTVNQRWANVSCLLCMYYNAVPVFIRQNLICERCIVFIFMCIIICQVLWFSDIFHWDMLNTLEGDCRALCNIARLDKQRWWYFSQPIQCLVQASSMALYKKNTKNNYSTCHMHVYN